MRTKIYFTALLITFLIQKSISQEIYKNEKYGFSVEAPKDWAILNHKDITDEARKSHGQKLITYYKNTTNVEEEINPTITVFVIANTFKTTEDFNKKITRRRFDKNLLNYNVKDKPLIINVDGKYGALEIATYTINNKKDDYLKVRRKSYAFLTKDYIFYISFIDERYSEENTVLFESLIKSIKIPR